jgi:prepilin-type N-terminal cleavage/methylation domain-containing protein/prepilin-type processing-associated H-X9-DG protein
MRKAFTLIELLVVIAIIALLVGILLPSLAGARKSARELACTVNFKQYGVGFELYAQSSKDFMPTEGISEGDTSARPLGAWDDPSFWANAVPALLAEPNPRYYDLQEAQLAGQGVLPGAGSKSLFVCAEAGPAMAGESEVETDGRGYFMMWGLAPGATSIAAPRVSRPTYWCYVYNSGLDNLSGGVIDRYGTKHLRTNNISAPTQTVVMVEAMMRPTEIDPPFAGRLNKAKTKGNNADSCRLTGRHRKGGNLLFADGHIEYMSRKDATTDVSGDGTYNRPSVIWQPRR